MSISAMNFPELRAPTAVNPVNEALGAAIDMYYNPQKQAAAVNLANAQANQANAMANFTPVQLVASLLSNPSLVSQMRPDTLQNLTTFASNGLDRGVNRMNMYPNGQVPGLLQNIVSSLKGNNGGVGPASGGSAPLMGAPNNMGNAPMNNGMVNPNMGSQAGSIPSPSNNSVIPNSTINNIARGTALPGTSGGINPVNVAGAQGKGLDTTATTEAANFANQWKDRQDRRALDANNANQAMIYNNNILNKYNDLSDLERGPLLGRLGAFTSNAQDFDRYVSNRAALISQALSSGNITGNQFDAAKAMKVTRENLSDSIQHAVAFDNALQQRTAQHLAFDLEAKGNGLLPAEADALWNRYIQDKPFWDPKKNEVIPENLDYSAYFDPKMIAWARNPTAVPLPKLNKNSVTSQIGNALSNSNTNINNLPEGKIEATATGRDGKQRVKINGKWY